MKAFQPIKDSMGGGGPMPFVYLEKRAAEIWCKEHNEEWISYIPEEVEVRELTKEEGAVKSQLVQIRRDTSNDLIRARAMKKLNAEDKRVLGLS